MIKYKKLIVRFITKAYDMKNEIDRMKSDIFNI